MLHGLLTGSDYHGREWLEFLTVSDLKSLSSVSSSASQSPLRELLMERAVWRLPYPMQCHSSVPLSPSAALALDWILYERTTYLGPMDAAMKQRIRAVSVPRSAVLGFAIARLRGVCNVRNWQFTGAVAGVDTLTALDRRRVYTRQREINCYDVDGSDTLRVLSLRHVNIVHLPEITKWSETLESLDLSNSTVHDASELQCVGRLRQLKTLDLERTGVNDLAFLRTLTRLETLHLGGVTIPSLDKLALAPTLTSLDISNVWLDHERVELTGLPQLRCLRADRLGAMGPLDIQLAAPHLERCSLRSCWLAHFDFVASCPKLRDVDFRDATHFGEPRMPRMPHLQRLQLSANPATIASVAWLESPQLDALNMSAWNPAFPQAERIDASFLASLRSLQTLEILALSRYEQLPLLSVEALTIHEMETGDEQVVHKLISTNEKLEKLSLLAKGNLTLTLLSLPRPELVRELRFVNIKLRNLDLLGSFVKLQSLEISGERALDPPGSSETPLSFLSCLSSSLTSLTISHNTAFCDLTPVAALTKLETLSIRHTSIDDVSALAQMATLRDLALDYTLVTDVQGLGSLARLQRVLLPGAIDCAVFHDVAAFPLLGSIVHQLCTGAHDCFIMGHDAIAPC